MGEGKYTRPLETILLIATGISADVVSSLDNNSSIGIRARSSGAAASTSLGKMEKGWEREASPALTKSFRSRQCLSIINSNYDPEQESIISKLWDYS